MPGAASPNAVPLRTSDSDANPHSLYFDMSGTDATRDGQNFSTGPLGSAEAQLQAKRQSDATGSRLGSAARYPWTGAGPVAGIAPLPRN